MRRLFSWLQLPANLRLEGMDDLSATLLHAEIIQQKPFLRRLYMDFYHELDGHLSDPDNGTIVELGSGSGFIKDVIPFVFNYCALHKEPCKQI